MCFITFGSMASRARGGRYVHALMNQLLGVCLWNSGICYLLSCLDTTHSKRYFCPLMPNWLVDGGSKDIRLGAQAYTDPGLICLR